MVYCGKPSKGCKTCRDRKIRCDQSPGGCTNCVKIQRPCPGYRNQLDLMFRNESTQVIKKAKAKAVPRSKKGSLSPSSSASSATSVSDDFSLATPTEAGDAEEATSTHRSLPCSYYFAPNLDDQANGFFFTNYVVGGDSITRSQVDTWGENLLTSMKAVGLAGLSTFARAQSLKNEALRLYLTSIRLTNDALRSPVEVKKNTTFLAIMNLSFFEAIVGGNQRSLTAWRHHVNGAAALIKLRGLEQLTTPEGMRMFLQSTFSLTITCIQQGIDLPDHIREMREEVCKKIPSSKDPTWMSWEFAAAFVSFQASVKAGRISDPRTIIAQALAIDALSPAIFANAHPSWQYKRTYTSDDPDLVYVGYYDEYTTFISVQTWNAIRTFRLLLHEYILRALAADAAAPGSRQFSQAERAAQLESSTEITSQLQAEVIASVPQHLGYVSMVRRKATGAPVARDRPMFLWSDFGGAAAPLIGIPTVAFTLPQVRFAGGNMLPWSLFVVGRSPLVEPNTRQWIISTLRSMGESMSIQQALALAERLEVLNAQIRSDIPVRGSRSPTS